MTIQNTKTGESWGESQWKRFWNEHYKNDEEQQDPHGVAVVFREDKTCSLEGWDSGNEPFIPIDLDPATYRVYDEAREAEIREVLKTEYGRVTYKADSPETDINTRTHYEGGMYSIQIVAHKLGINLEEKA